MKFPGRYASEVCSATAAAMTETSTVATTTTITITTQVTMTTTSTSTSTIPNTAAAAAAAAATKYVYSEPFQLAESDCISVVAEVSVVVEVVLQGHSISSISYILYI